MIAAIMCGGRGSRMDSPMEKLLQPVAGKAIVERVVDSLAGSKIFHSIFAVVSPNAPRTREFVLSLAEARGIRIIETAGSGFASDLSRALAELKPEKVFVVPADLALLNPAAVSRVVDQLVPTSQSFAAVSAVITKRFAEATGARACVLVDLDGVACCHSGVTLFDTAKVSGNGPVEEKYVQLDLKELAVNVNTKKELQAAQLLVERSKHFSQDAGF